VGPWRALEGLVALAPVAQLLGHLGFARRDALFAVAIERHITLDRTMYGSDQSASLEPDELRTLVARLDDQRTWLGDGEKRITPGEAEVAKKLRYWS
jgi:sialic acid synthase SpsE